MKLSRFLDDIVKTAVSQAAVILFGMIVMKVMAVALTPEYFGLFSTIKRWIAVLVPLVSLNMGVGLARYIGAEKEKSNDYMNAAFLFSGGILVVILAGIGLFPKTFSLLLFNGTGFVSFVYLSFAFLAANVINLLCYSYLRGKFDMKKANTVWVVFFAIPLIPLILPLFMHGTTKNDIFLMQFYFIFSTILGTFYSLYLIRNQWRIAALFRFERVSFFKKNKGFLSYSISRIPASLFISLTLGIPVFIANYRISLVAAGYVNIVTSVTRLLSIIATPFNMVFLPKFSYLKSREQDENIKTSCLTVVDFILTFLPFVGAALFGLTRFILVLMFDKKYLLVSDSLAIGILFSSFFVAYALVRGILDGLFDFPYVNIVTFAGIAVTVLFSLIFKTNVYFITLAFCFGLVTIGVSSVWILLKKLNIRFQLKTILMSLIVSGAAFALFHVSDRLIAALHTRGIIKIAGLLLVRAIIGLIVFYFYWTRTHWYMELKKRVFVNRKCQN
ncbi:MAG: lipopolysaccharide biosynthesis protein [Candidatus Omnitrophota bacterium]